mmetsp:Transcript_47270/g.119746  ORF Transcript_47270/g.119746 Transcript_47270/m.119746 type:complete len:393 (-) Transcript_47270:31-1209(-)
MSLRPSTSPVSWVLMFPRGSAGSVSFSLICSCCRHQICAMPSMRRSIFCISVGMWNCLKTLAKHDTTPVPIRRTELMYSSRSVWESEKSSPRNSPTCVKLTVCSDKKPLSSTGKSRTAPVETRNAKPWPGLWLKISTPMCCKCPDLGRSLTMAERGTKKGSKRSFEEIWTSSPSSLSRPNSQARCRPWVWRWAAQECIASRSHTSLQRSEGARPREFRCTRSAPLRMSSMATVRRPMKRATCNAVQPATSVVSRGNSLRINSRTIGREPLLQAACRQVVPLVSQASRLAPSAKSQRMAARLEEDEKTSRSRSTSLRSSKVSLNTVPAGSHALVSSKSSLSPAGCNVALGHMLPLQKTRFPMAAEALISLCRQMRHAMGGPEVPKGGAQRIAG